MKKQIWKKVCNALLTAALISSMLGSEVLAVDLNGQQAGVELLSEKEEPETHVHAYINGICECGENEQAKVEETHRHTFVDGICECGENEHEHTFVDGVCECGEKEHEHSFVDGVCECGEKEHKHTFVDGVCECGEKEHEHTFVDGVCECGEKEHEHTFVDGICECGVKEEDWKKSREKKAEDQLLGGAVSTEEKLCTTKDEALKEIWKQMTDRQKVSDISIFKVYTTTDFTLTYDDVYRVYSEYEGTPAFLGDYLLLGGERNSNQTYYDFELDYDTDTYDSKPCRTYSFYAPCPTWSNSDWELAVNAKINTLLSPGGRLYSASQSTSKDTKAKAAFDYIRSTSSGVGGSDMSNLDNHTAYQILINGKGTCEAFALAYYRLCREMGVPCKIIEGMDASYHTYNIVQMDDGYWYYVDPSAGIWKKAYNEFSKATEQPLFRCSKYVTNYLKKIKNYGLNMQGSIVVSNTDTGDTLFSCSSFEEAKAEIEIMLEGYEEADYPRYTLTLKKNYAEQSDRECVFGEDYAQNITLDLNGYALSSVSYTYDMTVRIGTIKNGIIKPAVGTDMKFEAIPALIDKAETDDGETVSLEEYFTIDNVKFQGTANDEYIGIGSLVRVTNSCSMPGIANLYLSPGARVECDLNLNALIFSASDYNWYTYDSGCELELSCTYDQRETATVCTGNIVTNYFFNHEKRASGWDESFMDVRESTPIVHNLTVNKGTQLRFGSGLDVRGKLILNGYLYQITDILRNMYGSNWSSSFAAKDFGGFYDVPFNQDEEIGWLYFEDPAISEINLLREYDSAGNLIYEGSISLNNLIINEYSGTGLDAGIHINKRIVDKTGTVSYGVFGRGDTIGTINGTMKGARPETGKVNVAIPNATALAKYITIVDSEDNNNTANITWDKDGTWWYGVPYQPVTFNPGQGTVATATKRYEVGENHEVKYGELPTPIRTGYRFVGWYSDPNNKTEETLVTADDYVMSTAPLTLYADYEPEKYLVVLDPQGGKFDGVSTGTYLKYQTNLQTGQKDLIATAEYDSAYNALCGSLPAPTRRGYTFVQWTLDPAGAKPVTGQSIVSIAQNHVLYAQWTGYVATVTLDPVKTDTELSEAEKVRKVAYDKAYGTKYDTSSKTSVTSALPTLQSRGYRFDYWYRKDLVDGVWTETVVSNDTVMNEISDHTLYAHWTPITHEVVFEVPAANITVGGTTVKVTAHTYKFNVLDQYSIDEVLADNSLSRSINTANNAQISNKSWNYENILGNEKVSAEWIYVMNGAAEGTSDGLGQNGALFDTDTRITKDIRIRANCFAVTALEAPAFGTLEGSPVMVGAFEVLEVLEGSALILSAEPGATIYYTTDGTAPTRFSKRFDGSIILSAKEDGDIDASDLDGNEVVTIRAIAVAPSRKNSEIAIGRYRILDPVTSGDIVAGDLSKEGYVRNGQEYVPDGLWAHIVSESEPASFPYLGTAIKPELRVYYGNKLLTLGRDYSLSYRNNIKACEVVEGQGKNPSVTVRAKGDYAGSVTKTFAIEAANLSGAVVSAPSAVSYTGKVINPSFTITYQNKKLTENKDYTITCDTTMKEPGVYSCTISGIGNFTGSVVRDYRVTNAVPLSKARVSSVSAKNYTGAAITLTAQEIAALKVTYLTKSYSVAGSKSAAEATRGTDHEVMLYLDSSTYSGNRNAGVATVAIKALNEDVSVESADRVTFYGDLKLSFKIKQKTLSGAVVSLDGGSYDEGGYSFTGSEIKPTVTCTLGGVNVPQTESGRDNYEILYQKNVNAGTATMILKGTGNYSGTLYKTFRINKANIGTEKALGNLTVTAQSSYPYQKGGVCPKPAIVYKGDYQLIEGQDYTIRYYANKKVTTDSYLVITGKNNFSDSVTIPFAITTCNLGTLGISATDVTYKARKGFWKASPVITTLDGKKLIPGTDYDASTITYEYVNRAKLSSSLSRKPGDTVQAGDLPPVGTTIKVSVRAKAGSNYSGTAETTYRIVRSSLSAATVSVKAQTYKNTPVVPTKRDITVRVGKQILSSADYDIVSVTGNTKTGYGILVIRGTGEYGGTKTVKFLIK